MLILGIIKFGCDPIDIVEWQLMIMGIGLRILNSTWIKFSGQIRNASLMKELNDAILLKNCDEVLKGIEIPNILNCRYTIFFHLGENA